MARLIMRMVKTGEKPSEEELDMVEEVIKDEEEEEEEEDALSVKGKENMVIDNEVTIVFICLTNKCVI
jgi:uncharacterized membrane protein